MLGYTVFFIRPKQNEVAYPVSPGNGTLLTQLACFLQGFERIVLSPSLQSSISFPRMVWRVPWCTWLGLCSQQLAVAGRGVSFVPVCGCDCHRLEACANAHVQVCMEESYMGQDRAMWAGAGALMLPGSCILWAVGDGVQRLTHARQYCHSTVSSSSTPCCFSYFNLLCV